MNLFRHSFAEPDNIMKNLCITSALLAASLFISGCARSIQTSSGREYITRYAQEPRNDFDKAVMEAANVEPALRFPARIGLARIQNGELSSVPIEESEAWGELAEKMGPTYGEFVPVSPLILGLVAQPVRHDPNGWRSRHTEPGELIRNLRLASARQHFDAILIYEVFGASNSHLNPASVANLTIIGGFLMPGKTLKIKGFANALLVDVRNGYPYGTATAKVDSSALTTTWGSWDHQRSKEEKAAIGAALDLVPKVERMIVDLRQELNKQRRLSASVDE